MVAAGNIRLLLLWYRQQLSERPYITNAATAGLVMFVGDRLAQHISRRRQLQTADCRSSQCSCKSEAKPIDAEATEPHVAQRPLAVDLTHGVGSWVRTATMTSWATVVYAPWFVLWYALSRNPSLELPPQSTLSLFLFAHMQCCVWGCCHASWQVHVLEQAMAAHVGSPCACQSCSKSGACTASERVVHDLCYWHGICLAGWSPCALTARQGTVQ